LAEQNGFGPAFLHSLQRLVKKGIATTKPTSSSSERKKECITNML